jgi:hypothetical protein
MIIELQAPKDGVRDWVVNYLSTKLFDLQRRHPEIARAKVCFSKPDELKRSCAVEIKIQRQSLFIDRSSTSFSKAFLYVLHETERKLNLLYCKSTVCQS